MYGGHGIIILKWTLIYICSVCGEGRKEECILVAEYLDQWLSVCLSGWLASCLHGTEPTFKFKLDDVLPTQTTTSFSGRFLLRNADLGYARRVQNMAIRLLQGTVTYK